MHEPVSDNEPRGLLSLLLTREERYVNPIDCWEDTYEGYHLHRLDSAESSRESIRHLHDELCDGGVGLTVLYDLDGTDRLGNLLLRAHANTIPYRGIKNRPHRCFPCRSRSGEALSSLLPGWPRTWDR